MSTSGGGGYCDCGDPEAWKTEPFCSIHRPEAKEVDESKVNRLQLFILFVIFIKVSFFYIYNCKNPK